MLYIFDRYLTVLFALACVILRSVKIQLCSDSFTIVKFLLSFLFSGVNGMLFGSGDINVLQDKDYDCKIFPFDPEFSSDDVYVQLAVTSKKYEAAVTWIGGASRTG